VDVIMEEFTVKLLVVRVSPEPVENPRLVVLVVDAVREVVVARIPVRVE
jgi:hypothetical protein